MYHACILHVSSSVSCVYPARPGRSVQDTCIVIKYLDVSWCIVMKSPRYTYLDVSWYVSSVTPRKRARYMYPVVSYMYSKNVSWTPLGYVQNVKIHVFSSNVTEHVRYIWDTSGYVRIHVSFQDTSGYFRIRILITNVPKLDNKCTLTHVKGQITGR